MTKDEAMEVFKHWCIADQAAHKDFQIDPGQEYDWYDLSLGFFSALGFNAEDVHDLAAKARYTHHYWC